MMPFLLATCVNSIYASKEVLSFRYFSGFDGAYSISILSIDFIQSPKSLLKTFLQKSLFDLSGMKKLKGICSLLSKLEYNCLLYLRYFFTASKTPKPL